VKKPQVIFMAPRESVELDKKWFSVDSDIPVNVGENLEAVSYERPLNSMQPLAKMGGTATLSQELTSWKIVGTVFRGC
jgi:hypothetical protein